MTTYTLTEAQRQQLLDVCLAGVSKANTLATKMLQSLTPNGGKAVAWQCKELGGEFWQDCNKERAGVRAAKPDKWEVRELFTHPAPSNYDQQAMELCNVCGWKGIFPGEDCLVCAKAAPSTSMPFVPWSKEAEMRAAMDALKAENNRFRAALTIIGNWGGTTRFYGSGSYTDVARAALGKGGA